MEVEFVRTRRKLYLGHTWISNIQYDSLITLTYFRLHITSINRSSLHLTQTLAAPISEYLVRKDLDENPLYTAGLGLEVTSQAEQ